MLDRKDSGTLSQELMKYSAVQNGQQLEDALFSLTHRINSLQNSINSKMDRAECMHLLDNKATSSHLSRVVEELDAKVAGLLQDHAEKSQEAQSRSEENVKKMMRRLKVKKTGRSKEFIKPQELYLESNETMFSMMIDEVVALKEGQAQVQSCVDHRHRIHISLNNEVCAKLDKLERELDASKGPASYDREQAKKTAKSCLKKTSGSYLGQMHSESDLQEGNLEELEGQMTVGTGHECVRLGHLQRVIQSLQKEVWGKISIKDLTPIIRKNMEELEGKLGGLRSYAEEAIESTKKILVHQSEINQELCVISRLGWWQSFQEQGNQAVWNKEIANMLPEVFTFRKDSSHLAINAPGIYLIKVLTWDPHSDTPDYIFLGQRQLPFDKEIMIHVDKCEQIRVPSNGSPMLLMVHKI